MQQLDGSPLAGTATTSVLPNSSRLASLMHRFRVQMERRRAADAEWIATFERVARNPRVRHIIRGILQESS
jgi:hypothetical protein